MSGYERTQFGVEVNCKACILQDLYKVDIVIWTKWKQAAAEIGRLGHGTESLDGAYEAFAGKIPNFAGGQTPVFVLLLNGPIRAKVLAHECVHLANFILDHAGVAADHANDEPMAYLVEWLMGEIGNHVRVRT